jgi:hypothetical protein
MARFGVNANLAELLSKVKKVNINLHFVDYMLVRACIVHKCLINYSFSKEVYILRSHLLTCVPVRYPVFHIKHTNKTIEYSSFCCLVHD